MKTDLVVVSWVICLVVTAVTSSSRGERSPVPNVKSQEDAKELLRTVYRDEYTKKDVGNRRALAGRLLKDAMNAREDKATQYVLLTESLDLAVEIRDVLTAMQALDSIIGQFETDPFLTFMAPAKTLSTATLRPELCAALTTRCLAMAESTVKAERFDDALAAASMAKLFAENARSMTLAARVTARIQKIMTARSHFTEVQKARETLTSNSADPGAKLTVGRYACLFTNDWDSGLPLIAESQAEGWCEAAKADLGRPGDAKDMLSVAELWISVSQKEKPATRSRVVSRAVFWFDQAIPSLTGLARTAAERRKAEALKSAVDPELELARASESTEKAVPTSDEMAKLEDLWVSARTGLNTGDISKLQEWSVCASKLQARLYASLPSWNEADYVARVQADRAMMTAIDAMGVTRVTRARHSVRLPPFGAGGKDGGYSWIADELWDEWVLCSRSADQLKDRLLIVEANWSSENSVSAARVRSLLHSYLNSQGRAYSDNQSRREFCDWLVSEGIHNRGVQGYRDDLDANGGGTTGSPRGIGGDAPKGGRGGKKSRW